MANTRPWEMIDFRMKKAKDQLAASKTLLDENFISESLSASYYAILHSATAVLLLKGIDY
jgi:uncharacterized protein (UPF0332 family)